MLAMVLATVAPGASAQPAFPSRSVKVVVPGPAGSSMDSSARAITEHMAKGWGVTLVVENRPGASATIGAAEAAKAAPDGHTILFASTAFVQAPHLYRKLPYDAMAGFTPVAQAVNAPLWFAVGAAVPAKSVREFAALAKASPGKFSYASPGAGLTPHLFGALLSRTADAELLHVPYRGTPPAALDVASGLVSGLFAPYSVLDPHAQAGKLRLLASTGTRRTATTPHIPTMKEAGFAGFEAVGFEGFFVPAGTPKPVVDQIALAVKKAVEAPEVRAHLGRLGVEPVASSPEAFADLVRQQFALWKKIIGEIGVRLD